MGAKSSRREFLDQLILAGASAAAALPLLEPVRAYAATGDMPYRTLGSTGEKVSLLGLGGYHLGLKTTSAEESLRVIRTAIDGGVNFLDNSWDYNGGESERRMGAALRDGYRQKVFLMTKTNGQLKNVWNAQLEESLRRLQTDVVDLVQFHEMNLPTDPDVLFGPNGAFEAALAAKKAGKIRYIGFTGHTDPEVHLKVLRTAAANKFSFATVQMPLNVMDAHFRSFARQVVPEALQQGIAVLGMKSMAAGRIVQSKTSNVTPTECLHYAMNLKTSVVINGCENLKDLEQGLKAARSFRPMDQSEVANLLAKTAAVGGTGEFEYFKTMDPHILRQSKYATFTGP
ncbi:MAG: aldo/keto reductase [Acidobacteriia bacterium]|nr:aldo/keto reductase [Terriglobia bacterium]